MPPYPLPQPFPSPLPPMVGPLSPLRSALLLKASLVADAVPANEPLLADMAPEMLQRFVYFLVRDFIPFGVVEHALHRARSETFPLPKDAIAAYAWTVSRELVYEEDPGTPVQQ